MKLFLIKSLLIASLCFLCVLMGMQLANDGMRNLSENDGDLTPIVDKSSETTKVYVFGQDVTTQKNMLSQAGEKVADATEGAFSLAADYTGKLVEKVKELSR